MKSSRTNQLKLLITRFPLESAWGGEEAIHLLLAKMLRKNGIETEVLTSCPFFYTAFRASRFPVTCDFQKDVTSRKALLLSVFTIPFFFLRGFFLLLYFRLFRGVRTVLFLTFIEKIIWTPLARMFGMKVFWGHHAPLGKWFLGNPYLWLWKLWAPLATIIVPSEQMKSSLVSSVSQGQRIEVLPNTIELSKNCIQKSEAKKWLQQKVGDNFSPEACSVIGTASRLSREKGIFDFLQAAALLSAQSNSFRFVCAGEGAERAALEQYIDAHNLRDTVFLLGFLSEQEKEKFFAAIDVLVVPSYEEPFGIVVLEAMAASVPVIATNVGGIPEVLGAEYSGLFPSENPAILAEKIQEYTTDSAQLRKQQQKNRERFETLFAPKRFEEKALHIFGFHC